VPYTENYKWTVIPHSNSAKYLDITLDAKLRWKAHVKKQREDLGLKIQENILAHGKNFGPVDTQ
jgi:hypothetical protein